MSNPHTVKAFDQELKALTRNVTATGEFAGAQFSAALDTFIARDAEQALIVRQQDEKIDALYTEIFKDLVGQLSIDPTQTIGFVHLLFCAKNIERIGDHASHIAEAAYLIATGHRPEPERQRLDHSSTLTDGDPN